MGLRCLTVRVNESIVRHLISTGYLESSGTAANVACALEAWIFMTASVELRELRKLRKEYKNEAVFSPPKASLDGQACRDAVSPACAHASS
jgi:hypothetical protein